MKKLLLSFVVSLFATTFSFAQDILWSEDFSSYVQPMKEDGQTPDNSKVVVPENATYDYVCVDGASATKLYWEALAGGTAPELLIGKKSSSHDPGYFKFTVPMNGKSGEMTLAFKANKGVAVTAEGATLGTQEKVGNDITYSVTVAAGTDKVTFTVTATTTSNVRFDDAKLYQGEGKKPAGLSWGTSARTVTIGETNTFPTLANDNALAVTYTSDNTEVATIDADGVVTLVAAGNTIISAIFEGNDQYEAQTVTYTLTVKAPEVDYNTPATALTPAQANAFVAAGENLDQKVYVKGVVTNIKSLNTAKYKNAQFYIGETVDATETFYAYNVLYVGGADFTSDDQLKVGDEVIIYSKLTKYTPKEGDPVYETATGGYIYSLNGVTAITNVALNSAKSTVIYNLAGQRISKMSKGINIINGKKVRF